MDNKNCIGIENEFLKVSAENKGAELCSIIARNGKEDIRFLWEGNPAYWEGRAIILFPIVGRLNEGKYSIDESSYELPGHGFGRTSYFELVEKYDNSMTFELTDSDETLKVYPYKFKLQIKYSLNNNSLLTEYFVTNTNDCTMYFSIGGHPGFNCPLVDGETFEDYYIEFSRNETAGIHLVKEGGLVTEETVPFFNNENIIPLNHKLFENDALVFSKLNSESVFLKSKKSSPYVQMDFEGFPFFGIWTKPGAPYVCLEPWCGVADTPGFLGSMKEKKGIIKLEENQTFSRNFNLSFFV